MARFAVSLILASALSAQALPQGGGQLEPPPGWPIIPPSDALQVIRSCPALPPRASPPTTVRDLRIDDFKVIAGLGDSITAGWFAKGLKEKKFPYPITAINEDRGIAFSMGGDPGAVTLPNIIRKYQPDIIGASTGTHFPEICWGALCPPFQYKPQVDQLNGAQSGALVSNVAGEVDYLVKQMKTKSEINFEKDWKLINLMISANDACLGCTALTPSPHPDKYEMLMRGVITKIRTRIPRVVVNVIQHFNVSQVWDLTHKDPWCSGLRNIGLVFECSCAFLAGDKGAPTRQEMDELVTNYNQRLAKIVNEINSEVGRMDKDTFAITMDPGFTGIKLREWPVSLISDVDCFHPAQRAHEQMAISVWNNLHRPFSQKVTSVAPATPLKVNCIDESSRVRVD
ncbi:hypothetical protein HK104_008676 [Borealophlyctis nickersoniae]|nr:hypothetical protein HK104_008676 [Borealophlyctis nickersoniae]